MPDDECRVCHKKFATEVGKVFFVTGHIVFKGNKFCPGCWQLVESALLEAENKESCQRALKLVEMELG